MLQTAFCRKVVSLLETLLIVLVFDFTWKLLKRNYQFQFRKLGQPNVISSSKNTLIQLLIISQPLSKYRTSLGESLKLTVRKKTLGISFFERDRNNFIATIVFEAEKFWIAFLVFPILSRLRFSVRSFWKFDHESDHRHRHHDSIVLLFWRLSFST